MSPRKTPKAAADIPLLGRALQGLLQQCALSHGETMSRSGRLALSFGIQSYETLLLWSEQALVTYLEPRKGGKRS